MKKFATGFSFICMFLNSFSQELKLIIPVGHTENLTAGLFSPDGKRIITCAADQTLKLWDASTGALLVTQKLNSTVKSVSFSPDGTRMLLVSYYAIIMDVKTGSYIKGLTPDEGGVGSAEFSPDGKTIVTASSDTIVKVWKREPDGWYTPVRLKGHKKTINIVRFTFDGKEIVSASKDGTVKIWDIASKSIRKDIFCHKAAINHFSFNRSGTKIVTASDDSTAKVIDLRSGLVVLNLLGHKGSVHTAEFSPDGKRIITGSKDQTAIIWDAESGLPLLTITGQRGQISTAKFSPATFSDTSGGSRVIITSQNSSWASVWDATSGKLKCVLQGHRTLVSGANFSADGSKIITYSQDKTAKVWEINTGVCLLTISGHSSDLSPVVMNSEGTFFATGSNPWMKIFDKQERARVWDLMAGKLVRSFNLPYSNVDLLTFSPVDDKIATCSHDYPPLVHVSASQTGELLYVLKGHKNLNWINSIEFSSDGKKIVTASTDETAKIWNAADGALQFNLAGHTHPVKRAVFSNDGKKVLTCSDDKTIKVWDAENGVEIFTTKPGEFEVNSIGFSPDATRIVLTKDSIAKIWDIVNNKPVLELTGHKRKIIRAEFIKDNEKVITFSFDSTIKIWDSKTGQILFNTRFFGRPDKILQFNYSGNLLEVITSGFIHRWDVSTGHNLTATFFQDEFNYAVITPDRKIAVASKDDHTIKVWNITTGIPAPYPKLLYTSVAIDSGDYFTQLPSGYYQCTPHAARLLHYVTKDLNVITFDQLDVKYNRPDKVLEAIGNTDTALINSYKRAYYKRIKKLGIDTTQFREGYSIPEADFKNRDQVQYEQKNEIIILKIKGADNIYKLDRFNIWINEAPLFGLKGISISNRSINSFDTVITVHLSQGENRIETSVTNVNGTESYHMPLYVNYTPAKAVTETVYFMGIGINEFADSTHNLRWCVKDIRNLALKLKEKYPGIIIDTLFNSDVTISNVRQLKQRLLKTTINDKVMIAYSGHGMLSKQYDYYLSSFNVNFSKPEENGIAYEEIENLLDGIPARKKLLLLDACHSGELDKDELLAIQDNQLKTGNRGLLLNRGSNEEENNQRRTVGLQNSFELMQALFVNVGKGTGAVVIAAAGGVQFAQERGDLQNGVFSFALLEAMEQYKTMTVSQLKTYVGKRVEDITRGGQRPTTRNELKETDWTVW